MQPDAGNDPDGAAQRPAAPRARRSRAMRWALGALVLLVVAAGLGTAALSWLVGTANGTAWLLARLSQASVTQPSGRAFGGPFAAERVQVNGLARPLVLHGLSWRDARWAWRPHDGAWIGLVIDAARVERVEIGAVAPGTSSATPAPPISLRLPLALTLAGLRIDQLQLDGSTALRDIDTRLELGGSLGREHRVPGFTALTERARLQGQARIAADRPFALEASAQASSLDGAPRPWQATASAAGPLDAIAIQAQLTSPQAAGASIDARATLAPFASWPLSTLEASTRALDLSALAADAPQTQLSGQARIDTRGIDQPIGAQIRLANATPGRWNERRLPLATIELDASARADQRDRLALERFDLRAPGDGGRIVGRGQWQGSNASVDFTFEQLKPAAFDARAAAMTLSGTLASRWSGLPSPDGRAAAAETLQMQGRLALDGQLDGKPGGAAPARPRAPVRVAGALQAQRSPAGWRVELREGKAQSGSAVLDADAAFERTLGGAWSLATQGRAQGFDPAPWWAAAPSARLNGRWQADLQAPANWRAVPGEIASWLGLRGKAQLDLQDSALAGVPLQGTLRANTPAGGGWSVDASLLAANNRAQGTGTLAPRAEADRWRVDVEAPALAALQPLAAALGVRALDNVQGALSGQAQIEGRWPLLRSSGNLRAQSLRAGEGVAASTLQAQWRAGADRDAPLELALDGQGLALGATTFQTLRARIDGTLAAHRIEADGASALRPPAWTDALVGAAAPPRGSQLRLRGRGGWVSAGPAPAGAWRARLDEIDARGIDAPTSWVEARDVQLELALDGRGRVVAASAAPGAARVLGAPLTWQEARWQAAAAGRSADIALEAQLEPMAIAPWLRRWRPDAGFGGDLSLKGSAAIRSGATFSANVVLERAGGDLSVTADGVTQRLGLTDLRLLLSADQGTWHFAQALAGANAGVLAGAQSMRLAPSATWPAPETPMQGVLEWGVADLGVWAPFTPPGWRVGGRLRTSAAIGGRFGAPEIEGRMEGSQLAIRNLLQGVDLRDGELQLSLRGADARVERFVFKGGDGELRVTGGAQLGAEPKATLQLTADKFALLARTDRRIVASGSAVLAFDARSVALNGQVAIDEGLIDVSRGDAPALDGDVTVRGTRHAPVKEDAAVDATAPPRRAGTTPLQAQVSVQVDLGQRLRLLGRGLDTRLSGVLLIHSPNGRLALNGQVRALDGQYAAYGQKLEIQRGIVAFTGSLDNPRLDILAVRPNLDVEVGVQIEGTAQVPRVRLVSTPEMADYDKLSWLVLGRASDGLGRNDTALLQRAALALLAGEGQGLDAQLLGSVGLDEFSVRQVESGDVRETVVTLGKQLSRRWFVGYERSVNDTTGTWQLVYRVAQRFTLRAQSGQDKSLDAIWTWRWN